MKSEKNKTGLKHCLMSHWLTCAVAVYVATQTGFHFVKFNLYVKISGIVSNKIEKVIHFQTIEENNRMKKQKNLGQFKNAWKEK